VRLAFLLLLSSRTAWLASTPGWHHGCLAGPLRLLITLLRTRARAHTPARLPAWALPHPQHAPARPPARLLFEVVEALSEAVGARRVGVRLSPFNQFLDCPEPDPFGTYL
jgi:hypothetical protein